MKIQNILFPTDFSKNAEPALAYTKIIAAAYNAKVHMFHAVVLHEDDPNNPDMRFPDFDSIHESMKTIAEDKLNEAAKTFTSENGVQDVIKISERGIAAAPLILDYAKEHNIDLIIMGTHGRRGLAHFLMGSVAEEVVRQSTCSVVTLRPSKVPINEPESILIPVDFSTYSEEAIRRGMEIRGKFGSSLHLLHVVEEPVPPVYFMVISLESTQEMIRQATEKSDEKMTEFARNAGLSDQDYTHSIATGRIPLEIVKYAESHYYDLILMGSHGHTGLEHFLLGSNTEKVLRKADRPVWTVKCLEK